MDCDVCFGAACLTEYKREIIGVLAKRDDGGSTAEDDCIIPTILFLVCCLKTLLNATGLKHESRNYCFIKVVA